MAVEQVLPAGVRPAALQPGRPDHPAQSVLGNGVRGEELPGREDTDQRVPQAICSNRLSDLALRCAQGIQSEAPYRRRMPPGARRHKPAAEFVVVPFGELLQGPLMIDHEASVSDQIIEWEANSGQFCK